MNTAALTKQISESKPRVNSKFVGAYYLLTISIGVFVLFFRGGWAFAVDVLVGVLYLAITAFLYGASASARKRS